MMKNKTPKFEDFLPIIDSEIAKRRHKWNLTSLTWMDFDDVAQIIRIHIFHKWGQYQATRPIQPWLNSIITNQIRNLIRNYYSNYARPCLKCAAAKDIDGCAIYDKQCSDCPLYARWQKRKQPANHIKIPVSIENHQHEVKQMSDENSDVFRHVATLHAKMKEILKPIEYQVYEGLFILHEDEGTLAKKLGYISNERGRPPGYKQIKNIRKAIIFKVKKCLADGEVDIY
jgi:DNA-directed RNA polymerase specialized sigma24 family protein